MVRKIGEFEKSKVNLQRSIEEMDRVIRKFEKMRVPEIGIPLSEVKTKSTDHFNEFNKH